MSRVTVIILHPEPGRDAGPLTLALTDARRQLAEHHRRGFLDAGAREVRLVAGPPDEISFGRRLRAIVQTVRDDGLVVLGSGSLVLATAADRRAFVATAASAERRALTNNRFSSDVIAVGRLEVLADVPDLDADNALPRWLEESGSLTVEDLRGRWRLGIDLDSPLDLLLAARHRACPPAIRRAAADLDDRASMVARVDAVAAVLADRRAEVLVAGRTSAATLRWLERSTAARVRAIVEERGLRAASRLARSPDARPRPERPPASILGSLLDQAGPTALGGLVARLADAAIIDSRVLLAHRAGADERGWPAAEDRYASDLLRPGMVADPWLRALTTAARDAAIPILLGGHTLVGPGIRLLARGGR